MHRNRLGLLDHIPAFFAALVTELGNTCADPRSGSLFGRLFEGSPTTAVQLDYIVATSPWICIVLHVGARLWDLVFNCKDNLLRLDLFVALCSCLGAAVFIVVSRLALRTLSALCEQKFFRHAWAPADGYSSSARFRRKASDNSWVACGVAVWKIVIRISLQF